MSFTTTHNYPSKELTGDYVRGGIGVLICGAPLVFADSMPVAAWFLIILVAVFGGFVLRTAIRNFTWIKAEPEGIRTIGILGKAIRWEEISKVKLRYFSTKRDRSGGWMQMKVTGRGKTIELDSALTDFEDLARRVGEAAVDARAAMDETTRANFALMGIDLIDFANTEPDETPS